MSEDDWTSPNGVWRIYKPDFRSGRWFIENLKTGFGDSPTVYHIKGMEFFSFDYPELVPAYIKEKFRRLAGCGL